MDGKLCFLRWLFVRSWTVLSALLRPVSVVFCDPACHNDTFRAVKL